MPSTDPSLQALGNVLVIGGCGFLGHNIVQQLVAPPYSAAVSVLDLSTTRNRIPNVTYYDADITSPTAVAAAFRQARPQVIIHTASPTAVSDDPNIALYKKVNVDGTRTLLACAVDVGTVKAFVYTSSASVIHDTVSDLVNASEALPALRAPSQREPYADTKAEAEILVLAANRSSTTSSSSSSSAAAATSTMLTCAIRPAAIFGPGDVQMVPNMHDAYLRGQTGFQLGSNDNLYDFTYVGNVAHAHLLGATALLATHAALPAHEPAADERVDGEAFLVTNGEPLYFWDFARAVWKAAGDTREPQKDVWTIPKSVGLPLAGFIEWVFWAIWGPARRPKLTRRVMNYSSMTRFYCIDKARRRLGYEPLVGMEEALVRTMDWLRGLEGGLGKEVLEKRRLEREGKKGQ